MTVMTKDMRIHMARYAASRERTSGKTGGSPIRPRMLLSVSLILAGMGLVLLMVLKLVPVTFLTAFLGFALTASGGTMCLIFCGDI